MINCTLERFAKSLNARGLSPRTIEACVGDVGRCMEHSGGIVNDASITSWFADLRTAGRTNKTLARYATSLRLYADCCDLDLAVPTVKPETRLPRALNEVEVRAMFAACDSTRNPDRNRLMLELLARCGLRGSELLALTPASFEEQDGLFVILVDQGKGAKDRFVPVVNKRLQSRIRSYIRNVEYGERLFPITLRALEALIARIAIRAGLHKHVTPHMLRHTMATMTLKRGANIETVRRMLGHDNLTTTQKYLALTEAEIAQDAQRADW